MNFKPLTEKEAAESKLLPKGTYNFIVLTAEDKPNYMDLKIECSNSDGKKRFVFTKIYDSIQLRSFCQCVGMLDLYTTGCVPASSILSKIGKVDIDIQQGNPKNDGSGDMWPTKNVVKMWHKPLIQELSGFIDDKLEF